MIPRQVTIAYCSVTFIINHETVGGGGPLGHIDRTVSSLWCEKLGGGGGGAIHTGGCLVRVDAAWNAPDSLNLAREIQSVSEYRGGRICDHIKRNN